MEDIVTLYTHITSIKLTMKLFTIFALAIYTSVVAASPTVGSSGSELCLPLGATCTQDQGCCDGAICVALPSYPPVNVSFVSILVYAHK